ncbi:MAG: selenocysteine-specific translation elongation factor [Candidatus Limnocylindrales bacterium]
MTVVVGTAGHIDHGKTALLRALTGIDADRLPEERRRGMTIDVGYAHMRLPGDANDPDGQELDFVDVPGHDRLVGNMLVGAGEIDAAMLIVAADEGPKAQTIEHLGLLDALNIDDGVVVLTKLDLLDPTDPRRSSRPTQVRALLAPTSLSRTRIVSVSAVSGEGMDVLHQELAALSARMRLRGAARGGSRLAIDRVFIARGRGVIVTGSLRGGSVAAGQTLRLEPGGRSVRVREAQVHGAAIQSTPESGRVALNLARVERDDVARGMALVAGPAVHATTRMLVAVRQSRGGRSLTDGATLRVHLATAETLGRLRMAAEASGDGEILGALILAEPMPAALDDRFVLRWPSPAETAGGGRVLDPAPPARLVRRRLDGARLAALARSTTPGDRFRTLVVAHGGLTQDHAAAIAAVLDAAPDALALASDVAVLGDRYVDPTVVAAGSMAALAAVATTHLADPSASGVPLAIARTASMSALRRAAPGASLTVGDAAAVVQRLVEDGALVREGDLVREPRHAPVRSAALSASMDRLVAALSVAAPPSLSEASRSVGCPPEGVRALEAEGRIVRLESDLAYATETFTALEAEAMALARSGAVAPAALRDATGTSRKYALAILEELDGRGVLRRTPEGHVLGPRAPRS